MQEKRVDDHRDVDGDRILSDSWTGFTKFTLLNEKPPPGFLRSGRRLSQSKQQPENIRKARVDYREAKARQCSKSEKDIIHRSGRRVQRNHQKRKKETRNSFGSGYALLGGDKKAFLGATHPQKKTKYACRWKLTNLQRSVWNLLVREIMTVTSQRNGSILLLVAMWCTNLIHPKR